MTEYSIICGIDLGESSYSVLERAFAEARHHPLAFLHLVAVLGKDDATDEATDEAARSIRRMVAEVLPTFVANSGARKVFVHTLIGDPAETIVELALEQHGDLVIVGRSSGRRGHEPGSIAREVIRDAPCSVLMVQTPTYDGEIAKTCPDCAVIRRDSGGEKLFCQKHDGDRIPRLIDQLGITHYLPGWGVF